MIERFNSQIALFKEKYGSGRVAVLADHYQLSEVVSAFRAGANAYFTKVTTCNAFIKSLELVMLGETIVPSEILSLIIAHKIAHKSYEANDLKVETDAVVSNDARIVISFAATMGPILATIANLPHSASAANRGWVVGRRPRHLCASLPRGRDTRRDLHWPAGRRAFRGQAHVLDFATTPDHRSFRRRHRNRDKRPPRSLRWNPRRSRWQMPPSCRQRGGASTAFPKFESYPWLDAAMKPCPAH
jgi:hypothetical protein